MGHERVGGLPHTQRWRALVAQLAESSDFSADAATIANDTLHNVREQFKKLPLDDGVVAAFQFLVALAKSSSSDITGERDFSPDIDFDQSPSALMLVSQLRSWVNAQDGSREYAYLATRACADAIAIWTTKQGTQPSLFTGSVDARQVWRLANNGAGFCEVSRLFFSKFTERYLAYFLDREASAQASDIAERDQLSVELRNHIDNVSRFAFETARITQSFAAGWFNNYARGTYPSKDDSKRFLSIAFGKIREELRREAGVHE